MSHNNSTSGNTSSSTSDDDLNLYFYSPSTALAVVFSVLYLLLTLTHGYIKFVATRHVPLKHKYTIPLSIAAIISTAGWSVRIASIHNLSSIPLYAVSASYIVISPIFVCATLYLLLTRLIRASLPEENGAQRFFGISPRWLGRVFITSDVFSFLTQCSGSGIASSGNWEGDLKDVGTNVLLVGLALQLATFTAFLGMSGCFVRRVKIVHGGKGGQSSGLEPGVQVVVRGVWGAGAFVQVCIVDMSCFGFHVPSCGCTLLTLSPFPRQIRSIYRVVEFALGVDGYPFQHEWCLYVLEGAPMFIALGVLAFCHPVRWMQPRSGVEFSSSENGTDARRQKGLHMISMRKNEVNTSV